MNTTYWINKVMNTMYTSSSTNFYIGLSSTLPTVSGSNLSEPSGGSYARVLVSSWTTPSSGKISNTNAITFTESTATWFSSDSPAAYWVLFDGSGSSANILSAGSLDEAKTVETNTTVSIAAGAISITLTDA